MTAMSNAFAPGAGFQAYRPPGFAAPTTAAYEVPGLQLRPNEFAGARNSLLAQLGNGLVRNVAGFPSQELIVSTHILSQWQDGSHKRVGSGQLLFVRRNSCKNDMETFVTLPKMNAILRQSHNIALSNGVLERNYISQDTYQDLQLAIQEDLEDDLDRRRRLLDVSVQDGAKAENRITRFQNTNSIFHMKDEEFREMVTTDDATKYMRYLSIDGILDAWNYAGAVRNVEHEQTDFKVLNRAVSGPIDLDNVWGSQIDQACYLYLILKREYNSSSQSYGAFQVFPWLQYTDGKKRVQTKYPTAQDLYYEDSAGYGHYGKSIMVGKVRYVVPTQIGSDECALRLAGLSKSANAETDAWHATSHNKKQTINVTLGKDCWLKSTI